MDKPIPPDSSVDVSAMSIPERIKETLRRSIPMLPSEAQEFVRALLSPKALTEIATTLALWEASHAIGVGEIADLILLLAGTVVLGTTALDAGKELLSFALTIRGARTPNDLDIAAGHFARAVVLAGITTVSAILLRRAPGSPRTANDATVKSEGAAVQAVDETPYATAKRTLDFTVLKKIVIDTWREPRKWPVKVFRLRAGQKVGDAVAVDGYITTEQSVANASLRELEIRLGLEKGYLGESAAIVRLDRLPAAGEFDLRFYNNIHGGGIRLPDPRYPLGPGYPQWELGSKIQAHITKIVSK